MRTSKSIRFATLVLALLAGACSPQTAKEEAPATPAETSEPVRLTIQSPAPGEAVAGPDVPVTFTLENYEVYYDSAAAKGQHIHFILDNQPYIPHYSRDAFVFKNVASGTHTIRAFPSRPWHESIKDPEAFAMVTFHVRKDDGRNTVDASAPLLTYSRPKGEYVGAAAESILVDFWLRNATLGADAYRVRLTVDGQAEELLQWAPLHKIGLPMGEHAFRLDLVGPDGAIVPGAFNSTERKIILKPAASDSSAVSHH